MYEVIGDKVHSQFLIFALKLLENCSPNVNEHRLFQL